MSEESKPEPKKTVIEEVTVPETVQEPGEETNRQEILNEFPDSLNEAFTELDELN
ncbi:MAG TPA: hypothetical protein VJK05_04300 [archaeon]|nr:hypothetical protein [archaeon]